MQASKQASFAPKRERNGSKKKQNKKMEKKHEAAA